MLGLPRSPAGSAAAAAAAAAVAVSALSNHDSVAGYLAHPPQSRPPLRSWAVYCEAKISTSQISVLAGCLPEIDEDDSAAAAQIRSTRVDWRRFFVKVRRAISFDYLISAFTLIVVGRRRAEWGRRWGMRGSWEGARGGRKSWETEHETN